MTEVVAEEAYFAESRRNTNNSMEGAFEDTFGTTAPGAADTENSDFDVSSDDDLPF